VKKFYVGKPQAPGAYPAIPTYETLEEAIAAAKAQLGVNISNGAFVVSELRARVELEPPPVKVTEFR
jgi:hypothetical protein